MLCLCVGWSQGGLRHHPGSGRWVDGTHRPDPDADPADPQGPSLQNLRHALGRRVEVQTVIQTVLICSFFLFFFYVPFRCSVNPWFQSSDDCVARHSTFWFKHPCMQYLWPPMTGFEKQGQRCKLRGRRQQVRACGEDLPQNQANAQGSPGKNLRHALG